MEISLFISLIIFLISIYFFQKSRSNKFIKLLYSSLYFLYIILASLYIGAYYFTSNGITNSVIYHLRYGLAGAGFLEYIDLIVVLISIILVSIIIYFVLFIKKSRERYLNRYLNIGIFLCIISLLLNPATEDLYELYFKPGLQASAEFSGYYNKPDIKKIDQSKNLVLIYAESLERTYFNDNLFPDLMNNLKNLENKSTYFTEIKQVSGTGYTMGGLVASQAGIPLYPLPPGNSMSGADKFLPSAKTIGDLLKKEGYYLTFYEGANLDFAGKGKFYRTHNFDEVKGYNEFAQIIEEKKLETNNWGLYDKDLFNLAFDRFVNLSKNKDKFALFMLTVGTHHPQGHYKTEIKYQDGNNEMLNAVASSDYLVSKFIKKIINSSYKDDTIIVLMSDHLALRNDASYLLKEGKRRNTFMIIDPNNLEKQEIKRKGSTLDITPTILPYIGYEGEVGLGRNLRSNDYDEKEINIIQSNLNKWRSSIIDFWDFPIIKESIHIKSDEKIVSLDDRKYQIPFFNRN